MIVEAGSTGVIGVFDSGVGGLTVVRRIWEMLPDEPVLFVADQAHVPYGGRPLEEVSAFARGISSALIQDADAMAVVMACNMSTATALETVRRANPDIAVLGVIGPGVRAALQCTSKTSIGVLATLGTVCTGAYTRTLQSLSAGAHVTEVSCPDFVPLIESEQTDSPEAIDAVNRYLAPIIRAGADVVILGCTHYPFLLPCLRRAAPHLQFIDPAEHTICELAQRWQSREAGPKALSRPIHVLYTTGDPTVFAQQISFFLPHSSPRFIVKRAHWRRDRLWLGEG